MSESKQFKFGFGSTQRNSLMKYNGTVKESYYFKPDKNVSLFVFFVFLDPTVSRTRTLVKIWCLFPRGKREGRSHGPGAGEHKTLPPLRSKYII